MVLNKFKPSGKMVATLGRSPGFTITLKRLVELLESEDEDDYGILKPTDHAFKTVMNLLLEISPMINNFPKATASTDHQGGIRLAWTNLQCNREVCLFCPAQPDQAADVYHASDEDEGVEDISSADILARWLSWLNPL